MGKYFRDVYFKYNPWVREARAWYGRTRFDDMYRSIYRFIDGLCIGQYFCVGELCRREPANHDLVLGLVDIYYNMDFFVCLRYDAASDRVTVCPPHPGIYHPDPARYRPPDVYSMIMARPNAWGVKQEWIYPKNELDDDSEPNHKGVFPGKPGNRFGCLAIQEG